MKTKTARRSQSGLYTESKVFHRLAALLDTAAGAEVAHYDRYSNDDEGGIDSQVDRHAALFGEDPDVVAYRALPASAFDDPDEGAAAGVVPITLSDIHDTLTGAKPVAWMVQRGRTVFFRIEMSAVIRQIRRVDGADENAATVLMLSATNHLPNLKDSRWFEDPTRAAREAVNWAALMDRHQARGVRMCFGGNYYSLNSAADRAALKVLGAVGSEDDPVRRRKLVESRLSKMAAGGAALAEDQMPQGWNLARDERGRPVRNGTLGLVPVPDPSVAVALADAYRRYAAGESSPLILGALISHEEAGRITRRSGQRYLRTFADAVGDRQKTLDAVVSLFTANSSSAAVPKATPPGEDAIAAYLDGANPADVFDLPQRLYIARPELMRTGVFLRALASDIRGRGLVLAGVPATYRDNNDEYGFFVVEAPWPWPTGADGKPMERFGIDEDHLRGAAARLLRGLRPGRGPRGGAAHVKTTRARALSGFGTWLADDGHERTLISRQTNSGAAAYVLLDRAEPDENRGWTAELSDPTNHVIATLTLRELCADVSRAAGVALDEMLDGAELAPMPAQSDPSTDAAGARRAALLAEASRADADAVRATKAAAGARTMAALAAAEGEADEVKAFRADAKTHTGAAEAARKRAETLRAKAAAAGAPDDDADADRQVGDASYAVYLLAGLDRAARSEGWTTPRVAATAAELLDGWRFTPVRDDEGAHLAWTARLTVPTLSGEPFRAQLAGRVRDARHTRDRSRGPNPGAAAGKALDRGHLAALVLVDGGEGGEAAPRVGTSRKAALTRYLMPWLVEHGITSRGAKNALVDHPVALTRRCAYAAATGTADAALDACSPGWVAHIGALYTDAGLSWGDAACPDDTTLARRAVATLATTADGTGDIHTLAAALGVPPRAVRELASPYPRDGGFARPAFVEFADAAQTRVRRVRCPHRGCRKAGRHADAVVMLPEVAASGFALLCDHCLRAPGADEKWAGIAFPGTYLAEPHTRNGERGSLRERPQTVPAPAVVAAALG